MGGGVETQRRFYVKLPHTDYNFRILNPEYSNIEIGKHPMEGYYFEITSKELPDITFTADTDRLVDKYVYPTGGVSGYDNNILKSPGETCDIPVVGLKMITQTTNYHNYINQTIIRESWIPRADGSYYVSFTDKETTKETTSFPRGDVEFKSNTISDNYEAQLVSYDFNIYTGNGNFYVTSNNYDVRDEEYHDFNIIIDGIECVEVSFQNNYTDNGILKYYINSYLS